MLSVIQQPKLVKTFEFTQVLSILQAFRKDIIDFFDINKVATEGFSGAETFIKEMQELFEQCDDKNGRILIAQLKEVLEFLDDGIFCYSKGKFDYTNRHNENKGNKNYLELLNKKLTSIHQDTYQDAKLLLEDPDKFINGMDKLFESFKNYNEGLKKSSFKENLYTLDFKINPKNQKELTLEKNITNSSGNFNSNLKIFRSKNFFYKKKSNEVAEKNIAFSKKLNKLNSTWEGLKNNIQSTNGTFGLDLDTLKIKQKEQKINSNNISKDSFN